MLIYPLPQLEPMHDWGLKSAYHQLMNFKISAPNNNVIGRRDLHVPGHDDEVVQDLLGLLGSTNGAFLATCAPHSTSRRWLNGWTQWVRHANKIRAGKIVNFSRPDVEL